jgi:hypothetical protein
MLFSFSANQRLPSGPATIPSSPLLAVGTGNSAMAWVVGLIWPILFPFCSVNQRLPSGPTVMMFGLLTGVGVGIRRWRESSD